MDLPFDDWVDLSAAGMKMVAVHLPSGALGIAILDTAADLPEGKGTLAHAEALDTLGYARMETSASNGWYRLIDLWKPGTLQFMWDPDVAGHVELLGGKAVRFSRRGDFVDRSHLKEVVTEAASPPEDQPARDLYRRTLTRFSRRVSDLKEAGIVPTDGMPATMADWPETVAETVGEMPRDEMDALAAVLGPGRPGEGSLHRVADTVWRMLTVEDLEDAVQASHGGGDPTLTYLHAFLPDEMRKEREESLDAMRRP